MAHILVIEDNEINQKIIVRRLHKYSFEVSLASDGEEGLNLVSTLMPDLILLDLSLPKKDGWTVATELKANPKLKHIPVIALTSHALLGDREKALDSGCDEYETKPVLMERLLAKMKLLLATATFAG